MDLANVICRSKSPHCFLCPIKKLCKSSGKVNFESKKRIKKSMKAGVVFLVRFKDKFLIFPVDKLSKTCTLKPLCKSDLTILAPIKPAPPVTITSDFKI